MRQKVVKVENYVHPSSPKGTKGSNWLTLACGHVKRQKGSIPIPMRCNCRVCDAHAAVDKARRK